MSLWLNMQLDAIWIFMVSLALNGLLNWMLYRDLAEFGMGMNVAPPIMSREEFEARQADLRRKRENERRGERYWAYFLILSWLGTLIFQLDYFPLAWE